MKNRFLRLASGLFVLCLITTSVISGTYAKYVTGDNGNDTARVAKWGVEISTSGTLFGTDYAATDAAENADSIVVTSTNVASTGGNVVAPGTKNNKGFQVKLTGQPEVAYKVTAETTNAENKDIYLKAGSYGIMIEAYGINADTNFSAKSLYTLDAGTYTKATGFTAGKTYYALQDECNFKDDYYPLAWTLAALDNSDKSFGLTNGTYTKTSDIAKDIVTALNNKSFDANVKVDVSYTITWEWSFEGNKNDGADTILGNLAVDGKAVVKTKDDGASYVAVETDDYSLNVGFDIAVAVTQVN